MLFVLVLFSFNIYFFDYCIATLLQVGKLCVPTATVLGPCHDCVCSAEGVYHCKKRQCYAVDLNEKRPMEDCEPKHLYRENTTFCNCNEEGKWQTDTCHEKFRFLLPKTFRLHYELRSNVVCDPGKLYIIDCNVCRCETSGFIDVTSCTNRYCHNGHKADACNSGDVLRLDDEICACSDINVYVDRLCTSVHNRPVQKITGYEISKLVDIGNSWRRVHDLVYSTCDTEIIYTVDCNKCVCTEGHLACTTLTCALKRKTALRHVKSDSKLSDFQSMAELRSLDDGCIPGKDYRYKCNTCHCTSDGVPTCATMMCLEDYVLDEDALRGALSFQEIH